MPRLLLVGTICAAALGVTGCGAGPRESTSTTIDGVVLDRSDIVGQGKDRAPGVRAVNAKVPKTLAQVQDDVTGTLFGKGEKTTTGYLNGVKPVGGGKERVYPGDRTGFLVRDRNDPAPAPGAVIGLYPAPFSTRFTAKRRLKPTRLQCADTASTACTALADTFVKDGITAGRTNLQDSSSVDVLRVYVGPWQQLRPVLKRGRLGGSALAVEQPAEGNGYGFEVAAEGTTVRPAAPFGEAGGSETYGAGTGFVYAVRDALGAPVWVVSGTDEAGVQAAAAVVDETQLAGRVAAVIPPR